MSASAALSGDPGRLNPLQNFQDLMRRRVRNILFVASLYDLYLFEEDGRLYEQLRLEYQGLKLSNAPEITRVSSGREALTRVKAERHFDLVICTMHIRDMSTAEFAREAHEQEIGVPIVLLAHDNRELQDTIGEQERNLFDRVFIWQGDLHLIIAIVKHLEDRMNVEHDVSTFGVQVILVVEDSVGFYSSFLPLIYTLIMEQSQRLIGEGLNVSHRLVRMRARPKILLCATYEEAMSTFTRYSEHVLGVISDVDFLHGDTPDPRAGFALTGEIKTAHPDIPVLLQSNRPENAREARSLGASFAVKGSPTLMDEVKRFVLAHFGFGDFVFTDTTGEIFGRADDLATLEQIIAEVPDECLLFHVERNHFSNWLKARTEFWLADRLRPRKLSDFSSLQALRDDLIVSLRNYREMRSRGIITEFSADTFDTSSGFARVGGGSLGGKARGLSFINTLLQTAALHERFPGVDILVPATVVLGTEVFDRFLEATALRQFALGEKDDEVVRRRFLAAGGLPEDVTRSLLDLMRVVRAPLAIRSSSLLEDSQYHPFAGVYSTYMIPNADLDENVRLQQLVDTVKLVYASTFSGKAKQYIRMTPHRLEEEKMAVIIQRMVGFAHATAGRELFYPDVAGVAKSFNFYPVGPQTPADGLLSLALGLGKTVVEGGATVKLSPAYPDHIPQLSSPALALKNNQHEFFALDMRATMDDLLAARTRLVAAYPTSVAEEDGVLAHVASTYSPENDTIHPGTSRPGVRIVTMSGVLKNEKLRLPAVAQYLLELGGAAMATPIEIEFAANLSQSRQPRQFAFLQLRPLVVNRETEELDLTEYQSRTAAVLCSSSRVLGNGIIRDMQDAVIVDRTTFDRSATPQVAAEVSQLNARLVDEDRPYLLIGLGRWGSMDPWLGVPVTWEQICGARTIVEAGFDDIPVEPSQGSHFFQNITSFMVGYFTVDFASCVGSLDWDWVLAQEPLVSLEYTRLVRFADALTVKMNGRQGNGVILKPGVS